VHLRTQHMLATTAHLSKCIDDFLCSRVWYRGRAYINVSVENAFRVQTSGLFKDALMFVDYAVDHSTEVS
jgi:hypothetical protein